MKPIYFLYIYLAAISLISIIITISDKRRAITHRRRIRERTLLLFSALGGSLSMYITMQIIRHKTQKLKFMLGIPIIMVFQAVLIYLVIRNVG